MSKRFITRGLLSVILLGTVALAACSNASAANTVGGKPVTPSGSGSINALVQAKDPNTKIKATWITPVVEGDAVSFPVSELGKNIIIHFAYDAGSGKMPFMAYVFGGKNYVRADICPPCRSYNFSIEKDILICDTCGSRFKADTGEGISGACVNYPKAAVAYEVKDGNVLVKAAALKTAYQDTLTPGLP